MSVEKLAYAALAARLKISPVAARSLARLPRSLCTVVAGSNLCPLISPARRNNRDAKMTNITDTREMKARIVVFGVGGAGGNAVTI
jgi:hypothetical protein